MKKACRYVCVVCFLFVVFLNMFSIGHVGTGTAFAKSEGKIEPVVVTVSVGMKSQFSGVALCDVVSLDDLGPQDGSLFVDESGFATGMKMKFENGTSCAKYHLTFENNNNCSICFKEVVATGVVACADFDNTQKNVENNVIVLPGQTVGCILTLSDGSDACITFEFEPVLN